VKVSKLVTQGYTSLSLTLKEIKENVLEHILGKTRTGESKAELRDDEIHLVLVC
jgi:hypothetical protein